MTPRSIKLLFRAMALLVGLGAAVQAAQPLAQTNVVFIAIDDLNDWVGFLKGHPQARTPNMDRLAARGVVFENAHCAAPLCAPSRAAVFSGRQPFRTGVYGNGDDLRRTAADLVLLPRQLKAHGYRTYGTGKLMHRGSPELFDESFFPEQRWSPFTNAQVLYTPEELPSKGSSNPRHMIALGPGSQQVVLPLNRMPSERRPDHPAGESFDWGPIDVPDDAMGDTQIVDWALERLKVESSQPFFLGVGFYRPHIPLFAPAKYFEPFPVATTQLAPFREGDLDDVGELARRIAKDADTAGTHHAVTKHDQWRAATAAYLACVYFVDTQIGRLLDGLERSAHAENTVIVLWGDHGWHLGEKEHWGKWTGWERSTRVPLAIVPPARDRARFARGEVSRQPVSLIDLYPTLLEFCGAPPPATGLDGESLVSLLREPQRATQRAVVTTFYGDHFSVRDERWRYIRYRDGAEELYDHANDPNEWTNVASRREHAAVKARLAAAIPTERVPITTPAVGNAASAPVPPGGRQ